jgi:hypothetical protein
MAIIELTVPPGRLAAPLHRHSREDEISFVVAGQMGALLGDRVIQARPGAYVLKPRGEWHTFWNASDADLRIMELIVPGGLELLVERLAPMVRAGAAFDLAAIEQVGAEYGVEFDFDSVPAICRKFGVTLPHWPRRRVSARTTGLPSRHQGIAPGGYTLNVTSSMWPLNAEVARD